MKMEKLIELIISFMKENQMTTYDISKYKYDDELKLIVLAENGKAFIDSIDIYRLLFGSDFIKRVVKNDKICRIKLFKEDGLFRKYYYDLEYVKDYDRLIMYLSVEKKPIDFLISYLK